LTAHALDVTTISKITHVIMCSHTLTKKMWERAVKQFLDWLQEQQTDPQQLVKCLSWWYTVMLSLQWVSLTCCSSWPQRRQFGNTMVHIKSRNSTRDWHHNWSRNSGILHGTCRTSVLTKP